MDRTGLVMAGTADARRNPVVDGASGAERGSVLPVSVIIPCYNCAESIARAMDSIACQTRLPAEVIVVDDASPDGGATLSSIDELAQLHQSRFKVVKIRLPENLGPASARNAGLDACSQPFVAFLDADDAWHCKKLEIQYDWMVANHLDISGHATLVLDRVDDFPDLPETWQPELINKYLLLATNRLPMRSIMVKASLRLRFRDGLYYAEDFAAWLELAWTGHSLWRLPLPLACSFKAEYGAGGLTANLWPAQKGELRMFYNLYREAYIPAWLWAGCVLISMLKFFRRWLTT